MLGAALLLIGLLLLSQLHTREASASLQAASAGNPLQAERAIALLSQAQRVSGEDTAILRQLAQAYALAGQHDKALSALEQAFRLQPQNLLIGRELAEAYERVGNPAAADSLWAAQGLSAGRMLLLGRDEAARGSTAAAFAWYSRALRAGLPLGDRRVQIEVLAAAILTGERIPPALKPYLPQLAVPVAGGLTLNGGELIWMPEQAKASKVYGQPMSAFPGSNSVDGVFWWDERAGTFITIDRPGDYTIVVRARHRPSPDGRLALLVDSTTIDVMALGTDWGEYRFTTRLEAGAHLLRLHYLADIGDAFVRSVTLSPVQP